VVVRNKTGRAGVPLRRSFETWVDLVVPRPRTRVVEVNVEIVDEAIGRLFNREFRRRDYATNVLSFPYEPEPHERTGLLGDILICAPVVAREAAAQRKRLRDHYAHLTIHGVLHLLGHDHENDTEAERMEAIERKALAKLGIADPYRSA
jgi:probable rRNA maturation factor